MNIISGIGESGFLAHSAFSAEVATKDSLGRNISETYLTGVDLSDYATEDWVTGQGYLTAHQSLDGLMSADLLEISDNKITGYNGTAFAGQGGGVTGDYELSAGSGISIVDYPLEQKTVISVTAQGGNPEVEQAVIDNSATWNSVTSKQDALAFDYHDTAISSIDNSTLYDNSAHARINTLAGRISYLSSNKLDTTAFSDVSGTFLTAHQDLSDYQTTAGMTAYLTTGDSANFYTTANESGFITGIPAGTLNESAFEYDSNNKISGYNGSAFAGEGTAGVSGTNVVFVPEYEGADWGKYYSATISGDVIITTGIYYDNGTAISPGYNYSLSSVAANIGNKLDKNKIEESNTLSIINNHAEVTGKASRQVGFSDMSAYSINLENYYVGVNFNSEDFIEHSRLVSAIVTVETTASGSEIPNGWSLVSYENNSAIFTKSYPLNEISDNFYLYANYGGWGDFTNAEGSATVYSALELAPLAFKDEISGITYTTGSI